MKLKCQIFVPALVKLCLLHRVKEQKEDEEEEEDVITFKNIGTNLLMS